MSTSDPEDTAASLLKVSCCLQAWLFLDTAPLFWGESPEDAVAFPWHIPSSQGDAVPSLCLMPRASAGHSSAPGCHPPACPCHLPAACSLGRGGGSSQAKPFHCCQLPISRVAGSREETAAAQSAARAVLTAHCSRQCHSASLSQGQSSLQEPLADAKGSLGFHSPPSCLPKPAAPRPADLVPNPTQQLLPQGKARSAKLTLP